MSCWKLRPSHFTFLWEDYRWCFLPKIVTRFGRPFTPFPKMLAIIEGIQKDLLSGKSAGAISDESPLGKIRFGEKGLNSPNTVLYKCNKTWIEFPVNFDAFKSLIKEIHEVLSRGLSKKSE